MKKLAARMRSFRVRTLKLPSTWTKTDQQSRPNAALTRLGKRVGTCENFIQGGIDDVPDH